MDVIQVKGNTWCLLASELIPVYRIDSRRCILLDSGLPIEQEGLEEILNRANLSPVGVITSHSHMDHVGNHRWLRERYGARICMSRVEAMLSENEGLFKMRYGAMSQNTMHRYYKEMFFSADDIVEERDGQVEFMEVPFNIHYTPGHSGGHICIGTPDGVCYVGDLLLAGNTRKNAQLPYHLIHRQARESMKKMAAVEGYSAYVIAHRKIVEDLTPAAEKNLALLDEISEEILELMEEPVTWEEVMSQVLERTHLFTSNEQKYSIYERAVQAFVNDLRDTGRLSVEVLRGIRHFQKI